jgi:hypothetical protein
MTRPKKQVPIVWVWASRIQVDGTFRGRATNADVGRVIECSHEHRYRWQAHQCAVMQAAYLNEQEAKR